MNLIGCWFDTTPCCHGTEGIVGQYKFGGMSGWCVALLGVTKLVLGLGSSLVKILDQFSVGVLGVLLLFAGIELAMCSMDINSKEESLKEKKERADEGYNFSCLVKNEYVNKSITSVYMARVPSEEILAAR
ncbi:molybdate transporter 1-like [Forsythia ovata]|uniref:Molybdate transporter 1-like n=1 Tax=Forsythia ovata TaxID=205694 RepID=A0ABD1WF79_9LAMI